MARVSPVRSCVDIFEQVHDAALDVAGVIEVQVGLRLRAPTPRTVTPPARLAATGPASENDRRPALLHGKPLVLPDDAPATLTEALVGSAAADDGRGTTYVLADGGEDRQTYRDLLADAARVLPGLRERGLRPGDSVLLHCDDNRNFVTGFWACLLGGFVPTPIAVAPTYRWEHVANRRIHDAWRFLDHPPLLTDRHMASQVALLRQLWDTAAVDIVAIEDLWAPEPATDLYAAGPEHPAVHLLTSGSTGVPKCVRHPHRTIVTRAYANAAANDFGPADVTLNFMPLDHVAGMVMHNLRDVILGCAHVNARTDSFIADPLRWFDWIERYRITNTSAPNFVITLVTKLADEIGRRTWDLASLRDITNGGEAIVSTTTHEFLRLLAPHGLAPDVMRPAWGMSEMCGGAVHSTLRGDDESAGVVTIDTWATDGTLTFLPAREPGHPTFTEVGVPAPGTSLRIVDSTDDVLPEDRIGRLQVRGPTRMVGYYRNPAADAASTTADGWFDTGDLGFVHNGRLVMTGREKDLIVIRSANYPCHEIESVVERVAGVLPTYAAAGSEHDAETGTDELIVFCVLTTADPAGRQRVLRDVGAQLAKEIGLTPRRVIPVPREVFPKTSAGKIERQRLLADYHAGRFDDEIAVVAASPESVVGTGAPWSFRTGWIPAAAVPGPPPSGVWVVFDHGDTAERIRASRRGPVVLVRPSTAWQRRSAVDYRIDPADQAQHDELLSAVRRDHGAIGAVVHGWATVPLADTAAAYEQGIERSALSLHRLIKACADATPRLLVLTVGACPVDADDPVEPVYATVTGVVRTANAERGAPWVRQLDLRPDDPDPASAILVELGERGGDDIVAYRAQRRLVTRIRPLPPPPADAAHRIRPGGVYLLTGGLGGIGFELARSLLSRYGTRLILNGRSEPAGERAARLARLAALGDVTYVRADVADADALRAGVAAAERRFGHDLDGVIHLAGADITGAWADPQAHLLTRENAAEFRRMYHAKVGGLRAVARLLVDREDALLVVFSSVNGYFGGTAFGAYSSASSFLPAFVEHWRRRGRAAQCQAWSLWATADGTAPGAAALEHHGFRVIEPGAGVELFLAALAAPDAHVLVGLDDTRDDIARAIDPAGLTDVDIVVTYRGADTVTSAAVRAAVVAVVGTDTVGVRVAPVVGTTDADVGADVPHEPVGDLERAVAEIWRMALRRRSVVGRDEHFFDLGGNSLAAMRLVDRLNAAFGGGLTLQDLYERPTVGEVAWEISTRTGTATRIAFGGSDQENGNARPR